MVMEKDYFRMRYFLTETTLSYYLSIVYTSFSHNSEVFIKLNNLDIKKISQIIIQYLVDKGEIIDGHDLINPKESKTIIKCTKLFFIVHLLYINELKIGKLVKNFKKSAFSKIKIKEIDALVLNRTIRRITRQWVGREHVDSIMASIDYEKLFLWKTSKEESDLITPLFSGKTFCILNGKRFNIKNCYRNLSNVSFFTFFNRIRTKRNTNIEKNRLDIERLYFLFKSIDDINLLVKSDYINEFLLGLDRSLINYSLTPVKVIDEKLSTCQGCIDLTVEDLIDKRTVRYFSSNLDLVGIELGKFYLLALQNRWGYDTSEIHWANEISENQYKYFVILSYIVNRCKIKIEFLEDCLNKINLSKEKFLNDPIIKDQVLLKNNYLYYLPYFIRKELLFWLDNNLSLDIKPEFEDVVRLSNKRPITEVNQIIKKVIKYFELNENKKEYYSKEWNPKKILNQYVKPEEGEIKYGIYLDTLTIEEINNYLSIFEYKCIKVNHLLYFKKNEQYSIYNLEDNKFILKDDVLEELLNKLRKNPLLSYISKSKESEYSRIKYHYLDKDLVWCYLYFKRGTMLLKDKKILSGELSSFLNKGIEEVLTNLKILQDYKIFLEFIIENNSYITINPFCQIDFSIILDDDEEYKYAKKIYYGALEFNEPIRVICGGNKSDFLKLRSFADKYLKKFHLEYISNFEMVVGQHE